MVEFLLRYWLVRQIFINPYPINFGLDLLTVTGDFSECVMANFLASHFSVKVYSETDFLLRLDRLGNIFFLKYNPFLFSRNSKIFCLESTIDILINASDNWNRLLAMEIDSGIESFPLRNLFCTHIINTENFITNSFWVFPILDFEAFRPTKLQPHNFSTRFNF